MREAEGIEITRCMKCKKRTDEVGHRDEYMHLWTCKAFPNGIPHEVAVGIIPHDTLKMRNSTKSDINFKDEEIIQESAQNRTASNFGLFQKLGCISSKNSGT